MARTRKRSKLHKASRKPNLQMTERLAIDAQSARQAGGMPVIQDRSTSLKSPSSDYLRSPQTDYSLQSPSSDYLRSPQTDYAASQMTYGLESPPTDYSSSIMSPMSPKSPLTRSPYLEKKTDYLDNSESYNSKANAQPGGRQKRNNSQRSQRMPRNDSQKSYESTRLERSGSERSNRLQRQNSGLEADRLQRQNSEISGLLGRDNSERYADELGRSNSDRIENESSMYKGSNHSKAALVTSSSIELDKEPEPMTVTKVFVPEPTSFDIVTLHRGVTDAYTQPDALYQDPHSYPKAYSQSNYAYDNGYYSQGNQPLYGNAPYGQAYGQAVNGQQAYPVSGQQAYGQAVSGQQAYPVNDQQAYGQAVNGQQAYGQSAYGSRQNTPPSKVYAEKPIDQKEVEPTRRGRNRMWWCLLVLVLLAGIGLAIFFLFPRPMESNLSSIGTSNRENALLMQLKDGVHTFELSTVATLVVKNKNFYNLQADKVNVRVIQLILGIC